MYFYLDKRNTYRTYDNILHEYSIARDYWMNVINQLKKEEKEANKRHTIEETHWEQIVEVVHRYDKIGSQSLAQDHKERIPFIDSTTHND